MRSLLSKLLYHPVRGAPRARNWKRTKGSELWFESPDALEKIPGLVKRWNLTSQESELLRKWVTEGYFTLTDIYDAVDIDRCAGEVDSAWFADRAMKKMTISDVVVGDKKHIHLPHEELLALSVEERQKAKNASNWRIGEFHLYNDAARTLFDNPRVARLCSILFDRPAYPYFSLTFSKGSMQLLHQDTCVFHTWPVNALIGVWTALEDIHEGSGPLVYYPGSHREALFPEFDNYPQTQRRTASAEQSERYQEYVERVAGKFERKEFLAKKGETLFWHGMLVHGGSQYVAPDTSRKSFVIHYMPKGGNVAHQIKGPFNW